VRLLAKIVSLAAGGASGWWVYTELGELFDWRVSLIGGGGISILVFVLAYFPLLRPIADAITDRLARLSVISKHVKTGRGLEDIPVAPRVNCSICGGPNGPICKSCDTQMNQVTGSRRNLQL